jgi:hypothetical protein
MRRFPAIRCDRARLTFGLTQGTGKTHIALGLAWPRVSRDRGGSELAVPRCQSLALTQDLASIRTYLQPIQAIEKQEFGQQDFSTVA